MNLSRTTRQRRTSSSGKRKAGMSLVETMMGSVVMTMVFAGVFSGLGQANMMANRARNQHFSNQILKLETQYLKSLTWDEVDNLSSANYTTGDASDSASAKYFLKTTRGFYKGEIPMSDLRLDAAVDDNPGLNNRKEVTLTLEWKEIDGREVKRTVSITLSEHGATEHYVPAF